jgi:hypothetical protein
LGVIAGSEAEEKAELGIERAIRCSCDRDPATGMVVGEGCRRSVGAQGGAAVLAEATGARAADQGTQGEPLKKQLRMRHMTMFSLVESILLCTSVRFWRWSWRSASPTRCSCSY